MDLWLINQIAPLFYSVLELSVAGACIGLGVLLVRKLADKRISPFWKNTLWLLVLVALVVPYRPTHNTAVLTPVEVDFRQQENQSRAEASAYAKNDDDTEAYSPEIMAELNRETETLHLKALIFEGIVPAVWLLGMMVMVAVFVGSHIRLHRRVMACRDHRPDESLQTMMERTRQAMSLRQNVVICYQDYLKSPALYGLFRPKILLPDYVDTLSEDSQRYILLHELTHLKHGDLMKNTILLMLQVVYWFNPLVWILFRFIRQDMELLNDERVLKTLGTSEATPYALSLIEVLGHANKLPLAPQMLCMVDNKGNTKRRIQMIKLGETFKKHKIIIAVACLVVIGLLSALFLTKPTTSLHWAHTLDKDDIEKVELYWMEEGKEDTMFLLDENQRATLCIMLNNCNGEETDEVVPTTGTQAQFTVYLTDGIVETVSFYPTEEDTYFFRMGKDAFWGDAYQMKDWMGLVESINQPEVLPTPTPTPTPTTTPDLDLLGITLTATDVTPTSMTLVCTQRGGGEYYTGERYVIERLEGGAWTDLPATSDMWYDMAWNIAPDGETKWELDWSTLYGTLELGTYRLSKEIYGGKDATNTAIYYAEFEVTDDDAVDAMETILLNRQMADVTHDGVSDVIETTMKVFASDKDLPLNELLDMSCVCDVKIYDGISSVNTPIYQRSYAVPHTGNGQLSLVKADNQYYLLEGSLYVGQGYFNFDHEVFSLDSDGNRQVVDEDFVEGTLDGTDAYNTMEAYLCRLSPWLDDATVIAMLDVSFEQQMVATEDASYSAEDFYAAMIAYYQEMTNGAYPVGDPRPLAPYELTYFNEDYFNTELWESNINLANQFLHSAFETPADIDLFNLFYIGTGADYAMSEEGEYEAVAKAFGYDSWAAMPTDVTPLPVASMESVLQYYTGTSLENSNKVGLDRFAYVEEYDCYYNLHGDTNYLGNVDFTYGTMMGNEVKLYYYNPLQEADYVVTLQGADKGYFIESNLPA